MMELDHKKLGLKCGIEIHQQLSGRKLFCSCPCKLREDAPHFLVERRLRASAGETGEIDIAALAEQKKGLRFVYEGYNDTTCLVELDEEPPHDMNKDALSVGLQMCKMLNMKVVDEIQVMRKTVVDGSNTSGFQRTSLVGMNGHIESSLGKVRIPTLCIEEESSKIIGRDNDTVKYRLDRLGVPLIEVATDADIKSPEHCKEVAENLGLMLRSTGKVLRGLGTIRQDVNVSIKEGNRVEIKGAQDLRMLPTLVEYEVMRQSNLLQIKKELGKKQSLKKDIIDVSKIFLKSESKVIRKALDNNGKVYGVKVAGFNGFIGREVQPGRRLGTEFSDRAKIAAGVGGIFHSDELPKYGITEADVEELFKKLGCGKQDAFVIVADNEKRCLKALDAVIDRANEVFIGIMKEVRKANEDGTSSFLRPMPGGARMYPETDVRTIRPDISKVEMPELISEKIKRYQGLGLGMDLAKVLAKGEYSLLFDEFVSKFKNIKAAFIAEILVSSLKEIKRKYNYDVDKVTDKEFEEIFAAVDSGKITKDSVLDVLIDYSSGKFESFDKYALLNDNELEKEIKKIISENKGMPFNALIGKVMGKLKGKAAGQKIVEMTNKLVS